MADAICERLGSKTLSHSGWHVYSNMDQILGHKTPVNNWSPPTRYASKGALPQTDDILSRAMNISVGVVDGGLGASFGINIHSSDEEIEEVAQKFIDECRHYAQNAGGAK
jgi:8-amino-3,8-dideoxy-alpha-D-manno-octulosonate transaminase